MQAKDSAVIARKKQVVHCGIPAPLGEDDDPFYSEANLKELIKRTKEVDEGKAKFVVKTMDELLAMEKQ